MFADFRMLGQWFAAMDSARDHRFDFNEAVSLLVSCDTQAEIDYYWERLSTVPEAEQCGWLKDKFGVSWQIAPAVMEEMMARATPEQMRRLTRAFLPMKKLDLATLEAAYRGT
jgi:predicted 3-demethylubiquinone-9 3-methyltransferase (glyoxalase superfamily)